ncbi:hypothetical protein [Paenibacillus sp. NPDC057934]|uniref:hypothetical protein n=1 Tax=Paenibacillus sp. NPDC057934 TaxID=3346282 RepID=UPI0036D82621
MKKRIRVVWEKRLNFTLAMGIGGFHVATFCFEAYKKAPVSLDHPVEQVLLNESEPWGMSPQAYNATETKYVIRGFAAWTVGLR